MKSRTCRKVVSVSFVALAAIGVRTASAAGAGLDSEQILIGSSTAEQCNSSQISIDYEVAYDAALKGYGVSAAQLSGLDERCQGYDITVSLSGPGGVALAEMTVPVDGQEMRIEVPVATPVAAEQLAGVAVVLTSAQA
jgi:hypothetical protein